MKSFLLFVFSVAVSSQVLADEPSKYNCKAPPIPNALASDLVLKQFDKHMQNYQNCVSTFVEAQQELSKKSSVAETANAAHDAAEVAIKDYNDYMVALNARNVKANSIAGEESESGEAN